MNMKTLKVLVATFVVLLATHLNGQASPITIGLHVLESDTKDARKIEVTLSNISGGDVYFPCSDVSMLRISVYKPDGSLAQDTVEGAKLKKAQRTLQTQQTVCVSNTAKPGQSVKNEIDVGSLYKIDTPGTYHVKAELDISDGSTAKSPQIDLMVK
jgi:hypothetical protein